MGEFENSESVRCRAPIKNPAAEEAQTGKDKSRAVLRKDSAADRTARDPVGAAKARPFPNLRVVSHQELQQHSTEEDCWIAVHGVVYDMTGFLNAHPGGREVIVELAGKDASDEFESVGHSVDSRLQAAMYEVGVLEGWEMTATGAMGQKPKEFGTPIEIDGLSSKGASVIPVIVILGLAVFGVVFLGSVPLL